LLGVDVFGGFAVALLKRKARWGVLWLDNRIVEKGSANGRRGHGKGERQDKTATRQP
jgi:hypothetical protein